MSRASHYTNIYWITDNTNSSIYKCTVTVLNHYKNGDLGLIMGLPQPPQNYVKS